MGAFGRGKSSAFIDNWKSSSIGGVSRVHESLVDRPQHLRKTPRQLQAAQGQIGRRPSPITGVVGLGVAHDARTEYRARVQGSQGQHFKAANTIIDASRRLSEGGILRPHPPTPPSSILSCSS
ncbi:hypothetical protein AJ78_07767 [Emergomyces pasteurianus Ep9510]|uniref:Uncharacterized protein n=1 Tax=Emergomyces pasteurianus Ep9510 TaxID=1447872 RepID=A0A1J9Q8F8_9EURO|nr:hypothetical protein AJ78_07767 [Emergomyces pasteurianus Ep9510]